MDEVAREAAVMATGEILHRTEPLAPWSRLSNILSDGVAQLQTHDPNNTVPHLIWLHSWGYEDDLLETLATFTLFGMAKLVASGLPAMQSCYYFRNSTFFSHRASLDAVINTRGAGNTMQLTLCINSLSPRVDAFRSSGIFQAFQGGLTDPAAMEAAGDIWIADCAIPRREEQQVLAYLRQKYGMDHLQVMPLNQHIFGGNTEAWLRRQGVNPRDLDPLWERHDEP